MNATFHGGLHRFAIFVFLWTILLFVAGALVTSNDAALSVPDWQTSHGRLVPHLNQLQGGDRYEFSHRAAVAVLVFLLMTETLWIWLKENRLWVRWLALAAVGGVVAQALLGWQVVSQLLHYWLPVLHACFAQVMFAAILGVAVFTSKWWIESRPVLVDKGSPSIHFLAIANAAITFLQVFLGAGFRHRDMPIWPHIAGSIVVLGVMIWTAAALRRRFDESRELSFGRILLHSMVGTQILLGGAAYWSRIVTQDAPQPMPVMVWLTVIHTVFGALVFGGSVLVVFLCYRLVSRRGAVAVAIGRPAAI